MFARLATANNDRITCFIHVDRSHSPHPPERLSKGAWRKSYNSYIGRVNTLKMFKKQTEKLEALNLLEGNNAVSDDYNGGR